MRPDHSLAGQPRFTMLQVIREYATERVAAAGEEDRLRRLHAEHYRRRVVEAELRMRRGDMRPVVEQYLADQGNIRAAMQWFLDTRDGNSAARMGLAAWRVWFTQAMFAEGIETMERALGRDTALTDDNRANAMLALGMMRFGRSDYDRAADVLRPALERYVARGDEPGAAMTSAALGVIAAVRSPGETDAEGMMRRAVDDLRRFDDRWGLGFVLLAFGTVQMAEHREIEAVASLQEGGDIFRQVDDDVLLSNAQISLGWAYLRRGDAVAAGRSLDEALRHTLVFANRETAARALDALASAAEQTGDASRAATLIGAAGGMRRSIGAEVWLIDQANHADIEERLHRRLGEAAYQRLAGQGASLPLDEVFEVASGR